MSKSVYTTKEWADLLNAALRYLWARTEPDETFIGSLKDVMVEFVERHRPEARVSGSSIGAMLPLTGLVRADGRRGGHTVWVVRKEALTEDDMVRVAYLRREMKAEARQRKRDQARMARAQAPSPGQEARIDETLTGHPEVVVSPVRDLKAELEEARKKNEELWEKLQKVSSQKELMGDLLQASSEDTKEVIRLRRLIRSLAGEPAVYEAFRAGVEFGKAEDAGESRREA